MMEKYGIIEEGRTPPEEDASKKASADQLSDHVCKRAADASAEACGGKKDLPAKVD